MTEQTTGGGLAEIFQDDDPPEPSELERQLKREFGEEWYLYPERRQIVRRVARVALSLPARDGYMLGRVAIAQESLAELALPFDAEVELERIQRTCRKVGVGVETVSEDGQTPNGKARFAAALARIERQSEPDDFTLQSPADQDVASPREQQ